jgi:hypothetical protein
MSNFDVWIQLDQIIFLTLDDVILLHSDMIDEITPGEPKTYSITAVLMLRSWLRSRHLAESIYTHQYSKWRLPICTDWHLVVPFNKAINE